MKFSKIFISYITKYLLAFLLVFITSLAVFLTAKDNIKDYILNRTQEQIEEGTQDLQDLMDKMDMMSQMMYESDNFLLLTRHQEKMYRRTLLQLAYSKGLLSEIRSVTGYPSPILVLFNQNDLFLSTMRCSTSFENYYVQFMNDCLIDGQIIDAVQFKDIVFENRKYGQNFLKFDTFHLNDKSEDALLYLTDGTIDYQSASHIFCFLLEKDKLIQTLLPTEMQEHAFLYIRNTSSEEELLSYGDVPDSVINTSGSTSPEPAGYHITELQLKRPRWQIVTGVPTSYINKQMQSSLHLLIAYLILGLIAVFLLTLTFSLTRYYGFKKVLSSIPDKDVTAVTFKRFNDYKYLAHNVTLLDQKKEAYRLQVNQLQDQYQAILLENLITRGLNTEQERIFFEDFFKQEPEFYCVAMVRFMQTPPCLNRDAATVDMLDFLNNNQLLLQCNVRSGIYDELFLIELPVSSEGNTSGVLHIFSEMAAMISEKYNCILHIGISTVGTGLSNISKCYEQTKRIVQSQYLYENENRVQTYDSTENLLHENPITPEYLTRLYTILVCGQYSDAEKELRQIEGRYTRMPYLYELHREQLFYSLKNIFYTAMLHLNCTDWREHLPAYSTSLSCSDMLAGFQDSACWLCEYISQKKKSKNIDLKDSISRILEEKYKDPDLSAYSVSKEVGISEKYLYQFWKEQTQETFVTSLLRIRIDKAKTFLEQTDYSNNDIAVLVGFASANTFYRNFVKVMGISPKVYREQMKGTSE